MKPLLGILTFTLAFVIAGPGSALHCNGNIITIATGVETLYIDDRSDEAGELNHWTYLESNDVEGLQSGTDNVCLDHCWFIDPCAHPMPDTYIL